MGVGLYMGESLARREEPVWPAGLSHRPLPNWRIGKLYKQQVRGLYQDIGQFCDQLEGDALPELQQPAGAVRTACDNFVVAIKQLRLLQKSLRRHLAAEAPVLREHYELLRYRVATTVHQMQKLSCHTDEEALTRAVTALKQELHRQDLLAGTALSVLLDDETTGAEQIITLVKDNGTAHRICNSLIDGAVILLLQGEGDIIAPLHEEEAPRCPLWLPGRAAAAPVPASADNG